MRVLLDASAMLALIYEEPGWDIVYDLSDHALITSVNLCEVGTTLVNGGLEAKDALGWIERIGMPCLDVTTPIASRAIELREPTKHKGLSLGDRICLAAAKERGLPVLTADAAWEGLNHTLEIDIRFIR